MKKGLEITQGFFVLGVFLVFISFLLILFGKQLRAEQILSVSYFFLLLGAISFIKSFFKK